jgi:hypothetical protein
LDTHNLYPLGGDTSKNIIKLILLLSLTYLVGACFFWQDSEVSVAPDREIGDSFLETHTVKLESSGAAITEEARNSEKSTQAYSWDYEGYRWHLTLSLDDNLYDTYTSRTRNRDYDLFASDPYDDLLIENIADALYSLSREYGLEEGKIPELCVSFVQSLNYTSDIASSGYDQYPRFPYETLYKNGGDCEDTSILSVAILKEMGYDVVLLELPEHMAVGIKCDPDHEGRSFEYEGSNYYYLETTGSDWQIGEMPEKYADQPVKIIPVYKRPLMNLDFQAQCEYSKKDGLVDINVTVRNVGSETARNTTVYVALQAEDEIQVWDTVQSSSVILEPEGIYNYTASGLAIPAGKTFRVYVQVQGENLVSENITSEWVKI